MSSYVPDVSIVIPLYGGADLTRACLDSLARHPSKFALEILVVDDASPDAQSQALLDELEAQGSVQVLRQDQNRGFASACNRGYRAAKAPLVLLLNNDTEVLAGWLDPLLQAFEDPRVAIAGSLLLYPGGHLIQHAGIGTTRRKKQLRVFHYGQYWRVDELAWATQTRNISAVTGACMAVRRSALGQADLLDEGYRNGYEDLDLCFRMRKQGWLVRYCGNSRVIHHESVSEGRFEAEAANSARFLERWSASEEFVDPCAGHWELLDRRARREYIVHPTPTGARRVARLARAAGAGSEAGLWEQLARGGLFRWRQISARRCDDLRHQLGLTDLTVRGQGSGS